MFHIKKTGDIYSKTVNHSFASFLQLSQSNAHHSEYDSYQLSSSSSGGNWQNGLKSGPGVYEYEDGELDVSFYKEDMRVGEGVRWSASREEASRLVDGQLVGKEGDMPVNDAMKLTKHLGFVV